MDVAAWLRELGLERYREAFRDNEIDARILPKLTSDDLKEIGVGPVGHRRTLLEAIAALNQPERSHSASPPDAGPPAEAAGTRRSEAERRQLTVMFVDLVGSTELSRRLDPEDMSEVMRGYRGRTTEVIQRWGGHVAKYLGDGVLAYFGWPQAHEDDAERAVRAGLALSHAIAETDDGADGKLAARIGIATGPVVVGELVGEGSAKEEAVVGETPNLAARLQAAAAPGGLIVSATTRRLLGELFELDRIDGLQLKGFGDDPVPFRILGEGRSESRFEATRGRKLTPLVGREHELGLLLDRWSRAKDGEGQVVLLSGEAGIGKSRLLRALRERLLDEPHVALPHYGSAHHINSDFHPIVQHLERAAAFLREDPESVRLDKLEALLRPSGVELGRVVPLIAPLFGLDPSERYPPLDLTPQRRRQLTLEALIAQVEALAREQPVLAIYEDVHWFDPSTIDAISLMIERVADLRVLVLIAFRPDFAPPWQGYGPTTLLSLSRLARRDGAGMIARLTGGQPLPHELEAELLARTDGIPLFVEELTKAVLESGLLHHTASGYAFSGSLPTLAIPASLQDSLMARLDRMAPVREVAQIAAVVGRDFDYRVLSAVVGMGDARLREALGQLVDAEIVFCRGAPPDAVFTFKHALLQEAAYGSLLHRNRRFLHERVAQVLEASSDAEAAVVAVHWAASLNHDKAVYYLLKAARRSLDRGALQEAKSHIESGLDHLDHLPTDANRDKTELEFKVMLGSASLTLLGPSAPETLATYERVLELAQACDDAGRRSFALHGVWQSFTTRANHGAAIATAGKMLRLAESRQDHGSAFVSRRMLGASLLFRGQLVEARRELEYALASPPLDRARHESVNYTLDPVATCQAMLSIVLWLCGHVDASTTSADAALRRAEEVAHAHTSALVKHYAKNVLLVLRRDYDEARSATGQLLLISRDNGFPHWIALTTILHGVALELSSSEEEGVGAIEDGLQSLAAIGWQQFRPFYLCTASLVDMGRGNFDIGSHRLNEALACVGVTEECWAESEVHRCLGDIALRRRDDRQQSERAYLQALNLARAQSAKSWELRAATSLARLWHVQGRRAEAHDLLAPVYGWFTEGLETLDLKEARALLDELA